ncbi:outer membrane beta-barrel protein [Mucilaginibacter robiniae]|uniref:Outer membrane beta-barrel protein n=1 Tax=Mucilaginibacter robiniae TaxID=2728022 RepID=A0A7L5E5K7_9SPHI|nr:outer membrane beta-barrel protein [Mucilaginibacter robiniae]QJD96133.1 outer membrane beta-barrel protein [Mucilaginibacter robiniae]
MKKALFIALLMFSSSILYAQVPGGMPRRQQPAAPPLPTRQVSGVVKDSADNTLPGALVKLESKNDTISTSANADGIFIFKNIKSATFVLTVSNIGYRKLVKRFLNNDAVPRLVLDPIILKSEATALKAVVVNGTPSITYKVDTVEYKAGDYKVRENATVDELLKKMEGFEVGTDGTVTHQGQQIARAKLNGKEYAGGDVAQAIQNLPAEIVEKIQVVDDYGDQAARTGIKDGDPQKVLNITTRADRSVGTTGRMTGQYGSNDRYNAQLFVQRINANQQIGIIGRFANTVNGIASSGLAGGATNGGGGGGGNAGRGGSPGTTRSGSPSFNYRDQWGKKVEVISSYTYRFSNNNAVNDSYGQRYSTKGSSDFVDHSTAENDSKGHNLRFEIDYNIDKSNYLQITPTFSYSSSNSLSNSMADNVNHYTTGFEHQVVNTVSQNTSTAPTYGITAFYLHTFKKARRNVSLQYSVTTSNTQQKGDKNTDYQYYADSTRNTLVSDSLSHLLTRRTSKNTTYNTTATYVEPIGQYSQIEFTGHIRRSVYDNTAVSDTVLANGQTQQLTRLDNIYNYSFTESRYSVDYRYNGTKYNLSVGVLALPSNLAGNKENNSGDGSTISTSHNYFRIIPVLRASYSWSRTQRISFTYSGDNAEPQFQQIQPFTDRTDPNNIVVGNPDLKPTFTNSLNLNYNNYLPNSKLNLSFNVNGTISQDQITSNTIQITQEINNNGATTRKTINEITYANVNGSHAIVGRYSISKQLSDRRYNLSLNGNITYNYSVAMSNDQLYHNTNWRFDERFGPRINPTDNIEINPYIAYDLSRSFTTLLGATPTMLQTTSLAVDGRVYFLKTFQINYSAAKSYVTGLGRLGNPSPLVINAGFEKEFFKRRNLVLTFNIYDLLHQNNFIQQSVTAQAVTNTLSNTLSRYYLVGLRLNLQKWSGRPSRNGRQLQRRGDGSFMY